MTLETNQTSPVSAMRRLRALPPQRRLAIATSVILIVVGVSAMIGSTTLGYYTDIGPGAGFLPFWFASVLTLLAVIMLVAETRAARKTASVDSGATNDAPDAQGEVDPREQRTMLIGTLCSLAAVVFLIEVLGFQLTILIFLIFQLRFLGKRRWISSLIVATIGSFGIFLLFTRVLSVYLPPSSIEFLRVIGL